MRNKKKTSCPTLNFCPVGHPLVYWLEITPYKTFFKRTMCVDSSSTISAMPRVVFTHFVSHWIENPAKCIVPTPYPLHINTHVLCVKINTN